MTTEQELQDILEKYPNEKAYRVMAGGNLTLPEFMSQNRNNMFNSHIQQHVPLISPESPNMSTGFEKPYGKYTDSYAVAEADFKILAVIPKFQMSGRFIYTYLVQNIFTKVFDIIEIKHYEALSEDRGYVRPYIKTDTYNVGDIIKRGETLYRSNSHDEYGNYRYGLNPKVAYLSIPETEEDACVIREGYREAFSFYDVNKTIVTLNKNQILLDLYGKNGRYCCFPDIGEDVKDGILYARRNINYSNIDPNVTEQALKRIVFNDEVCHGEGKVIDIDIWINDKEEFEDSENKSQIYKYYQELLQYYTAIMNALSPIVNAKNSDHVQYTYKLRWAYEHARNYLSTNIQWMPNNNTFEFACIVITTCCKKCVLNGYKITDRFGGKGVISHVWPDEYMPRDEFGNVADIILSPPGTIARANIGQNYEQEYNFIADCVAKKIHSLQTIQQKEALLIDFVMTCSKKEGTSLMEFLKIATPQQKINMFNDIDKFGIVLVEEPFGGTISMDNLELLYNKFKVTPGRIQVCREFLNTATALPLENMGKVDMIDSAEEGVKYLRPLGDKGTNKKQIYDDPSKGKGATPFDLEKGQEYAKNDVAIFPFVNPNTKQMEFGSVDLAHYKSDPNLRGEKGFKPVKAWINSEGLLVRQYTSMKPVIIGKKYYILLKQMPDEKFSARSLGSTNQIGIPNKPGKQSKQYSPYPKSAIKYSEMDSDVNFTRIDNEIQNRFLATHSTNPQLIEQLGSMLATADPFELHDLPIKSEDIKDNAPALLMHSNLYVCGCEIEPIYEGEEDKED